MNTDSSVHLLEYLKQKHPDHAAEVEFISLSGIGNDHDVTRLRKQGISSFLVGTAFTNATDPREILERMINQEPLASL
jgi:indole-3-glycerol phosphate synthase